MTNFSNRSTGAARLHPGAATLRVLAALLGYPDTRLRGYLPEMTALLAEDNVLSATRRGEVEALARWLAGSESLEAETTYVETFDRGRATSLHLFEHVHGDSRDRGPAMIDLAQTYERAGLYLGAVQLGTGGVLSLAPLSLPYSPEFEPRHDPGG